MTLLTNMILKMHLIQVDYLHTLHKLAFNLRTNVDFDLVLKQQQPTKQLMTVDIAAIACTSTCGLSPSQVKLGAATGKLTAFNVSHWQERLHDADDELHGVRTDVIRMGQSAVTRVALIWGLVIF